MLDARLPYLGPLKRTVLVAQGQWSMNFNTIVSQLAKKNLASPLSLWNAAHYTRRAAVMVILSPSSARRDEVDVLLTIRAHSLSYAGDAAFPGGKADNGIETPWETAVRETQEEVGIEPHSLQYAGLLPGYVSSKLLLVVPSIAWSCDPPRAFKNGEDEVHKIFQVPLSRFLEAEGHRYKQRPLPSGGTMKLSYFDIRALQKKVGDPAYDRVWGLTASILIDCARILYDRSPEFEFHRTHDLNIVDPTSIGNQALLESLAERQILQQPVKRRRR